MDKEFTPDLITLVDEEGNEHNFEILDKIENDNGEFYALYPVFDDAEDSVNDSGEYYIMEVVQGEDGEEDEAAEDVYAICVNKKQKNLLNAINEVLAELGDDGVQALVNKHLGITD